MRRITGGIFLSLDGVMQAPGGPNEDPTGGFAHGGWMAGMADEAVMEPVGRLFTPPYALLLGRFTYDIFAAHWPFVTGEEAGFAQALNAADKYVVTHGTMPLEWENSHALPDIAAVAALKATEGPDLLIQGSGTLYPQLLAAGLIDRLVTMTFPVVLGGGKRPFGDGTPATRLTMVDHKVSAKGLVVATYEPTGAVDVASFAVPEMNDRERARQAAMRGR